MIDVERKIDKKILFQRNINTTNYDVKYHQLELKVNSSEDNINETRTSYYTTLQNINSITFDMGNALKKKAFIQKQIKSSI